MITAIMNPTPAIQELSRRIPKKYNNFLYLKPEDAYKIKIENFKSLGASFFAEIYKTAIKSTADIVQLSDEHILKSEEAEKNNKNLSILNKAQEYNNIIAFCGERGTGKSSAMISFTQALLNINEVKFNKENGKEIEDEKLQKAIVSAKNHTYHTIDIIDPSLFEENDNIFEVIIAQLFSSFERELEKNDTKKDINDKRKVLGLFEKVYENLKSIKDNGNNYDGEALETLNKLACGANLRNNFKDLVNQYLRFICGEDKKPILVIGIDDFDLNVNAAVEMAEQIRKYLMIPQVIVLLAVNIDQLEDVKEQSVREDFKTMLDAGQLKEKPKDITARYLLKLIPSERRLSLPKIGKHIKETCLRILPTDTTENIENLKEQLEKDIDNDNLRWDAKDKNIEEYVLSLIYNKTGLIFTPKENKNHFLVPTNLRKFNELVNILTSLDCKNKEKSFSLFRNYLYSNYIADFFGNREMNLLEKLIEAPSFEKNKLLILEVKNLLIDNYLQKYKLNQQPENKFLFNIEENKIFQEIVNYENNTANISLRDVLYFLDKLQHTNFYANKERFIDVVKVIYSIELYKYLIIDKNGSTTRELCGESVIPSFDTGYIPKKRENKELRNDLQLNLESIKIGDIDLKKSILKFKEKQKIQLFTLCLPHFGSDYMDRRKENESFLKKGIVINNNLLNQKQAHYDLFSFITSEIVFHEHFLRFSQNFSEGDLIIYNQIKEHISKYNCSLPIYSIDLMQDIFTKSFAISYSKEGEVETLFSAQVAILDEVKKRIRKLNIGYIDRNRMLKAFSDSPFVLEFNDPTTTIDEIYSSISLELSTNKNQLNELDVINGLKKDVEKTDLTYGRFRKEVLEPIKYRLEKVLDYDILAKILVKTKGFTDDRREYIKDQIDFARSEFLRKGKEVSEDAEKVDSISTSVDSEEKVLIEEIKKETELEKNEVLEEEGNLEKVSDQSIESKDA